MSKKTNTYKIMYLGYAGDRGASFKSHGLEFRPRVVQPVTENVFKWAKWQRGFAVVDSVRTTVLDFMQMDNITFGSDISEVVGSLS